MFCSLEGMGKGDVRTGGWGAEGGPLIGRKGTY